MKKDFSVIKKLNQEIIFDIKTEFEDLYFLLFENYDVRLLKKSNDIKKENEQLKINFGSDSLTFPLRTLTYKLFNIDDKGVHQLISEGLIEVTADPNAIEANNESSELPIFEYESFPNPELFNEEDLISVNGVLFILKDKEFVRFVIE